MKRNVVLNGRVFEYELLRKNVKNINLRINHDGSIVVSANRFVPIDAVERFILSKREAVLKRIEKNSLKIGVPVSVGNYESGRKIRIFGEEKTLYILSGDESLSVDGNKLVVTLKNPTDKWCVNSCCDRLLNRLLRSELLQMSFDAHKKLKEYDISFPEIKIRKMISCWGICRPGKCEITFSSALLHVPRECAEYVVMHEFVHFLEPNHSKGFYLKLDAFMPDWRLRRDRLCGYYPKK